MTRNTLAGIGIGLFSLMTALPITAQEVATLALRNGQRPSGELIDLNGSAFTLRVNGQDQQFSVNDVAAVEFVGGPLSAEAQARVNAGAAIVLLRNGQVLEGRLSDIGGTRPLRLTIDTPSGHRDFTSSDVAQLHMGGSSAASAQAVQPGPSGGAPAPGAIPVTATQAWTDTGVTVRRGQRVSFMSSGDILLAAGMSSGPSGSTAATAPNVRYRYRTHRRARSSDESGPARRS